MPVTTPGSGSIDNLDTLPVTVLKGVGPRVAQRLERLRMRTVQDVLFHLPARYEDRTRVTPMGSVRPGEQAVVQGAVDLAEVRFGRRRSLLVRISDGTGALTLRFFHFNAAQQAGFEQAADGRPVLLQISHVWAVDQCIDDQHGDRILLFAFFIVRMLRIGRLALEAGEKFAGYLVYGVALLFGLQGIGVDRGVDAGSGGQRRASPADRHGIPKDQRHLGRCRGEGRGTHYQR